MDKEEATNAVPEGKPVTSTNNFPGAVTNEAGDVVNEEERPYEGEQEGESLPLEEVRRRNEQDAQTEGQRQVNEGQIPPDNQTGDKV